MTVLRRRLWRMPLSGDKTAAWARPAGRSGGSGHLGERMQRLAAAGGLLRAWGGLPPSLSPQTALLAPVPAARS